MRQVLKLTVLSSVTSALAVLLLVALVGDVVGVEAAGAVAGVVPEGHRRLVLLVPVARRLRFGVSAVGDAVVGTPEETVTLKVAE